MLLIECKTELAQALAECCIAEGYNVAIWDTLDGHSVVGYWQ
jgi:hypothetical protein